MKSDIFNKAILWIVNNKNIIIKLRRCLVNYYNCNAREFLWRKFNDPYEIFIAEILLQKTAARAVENVWVEFIKNFLDLTQLASASIKDVKNIIRPLGLIKRAEILVSAAQRIVQYNNGEIIPDKDWLLSIHGLGSYSVSAILSFSFNKKLAAIDVNAARFYNRFCGFSAKNIRQAIAFSGFIGNCVISKTYHREVNYAVLDLSSEICKKNPKCGVCFLNKLCELAISNEPISG
jgi:A/G-specific adenine glycosylase